MGGLPAPAETDVLSALRSESVTSVSSADGNAPLKSMTLKFKVLPDRWSLVSQKLWFEFADPCADDHDIRRTCPSIRDLMPHTDRQSLQRRCVEKTQGKQGCDGALSLTVQVPHAGQVHALGYLTFDWDKSSEAPRHIIVRSSDLVVFSAGKNRRRGVTETPCGTTARRLGRPPPLSDSDSDDGGGRGPSSASASAVAAR